MGARDWSPRGWVAGAVAVVVVALAAGAGVAVSDRWTADAGVDDVARLVPVDVAGVDVTDWTALRDRLDAGGAALVAAASDRDLATRSVLVSSDVVVSDGLGWAPGTVRWEAFVQTTAGTGLLVGLPQSTAGTEARLREVGYVESDGLWSIDLPDLRAGGASTPEVFLHVRILDGGVAVASAEETVVEQVRDAADGSETALADDPSVARVWAQASALDVFALQDGAAGCASTDPAESGADIAAQATVAVDAAGELLPYRWLLRGLEPAAAGSDETDRFVVAMAFETGAQAAGQVEVRSQLASGPFIGQTGTVEESIVLTRESVDGDVAVLDLDRQEDSVSLMSFVGPLVLASC
ncbi:hypothetical protein [Aeromicrobium alkaliterrae]|uniref:Bacterial spore germination immunoglobulin-like domain-containing protein n=1 Tax=Aeromicrobium alkaliterrae TaxID=302168 RepID=A0ABN2JR09_9ACTN